MGLFGKSKEPPSTPRNPRVVEDTDLLKYRLTLPVGWTVHVESGFMSSSIYAMGPENWRLDINSTLMNIPWLRGSPSAFLKDAPQLKEGFKRMLSDMFKRAIDSKLYSPGVFSEEQLNDGAVYLEQISSSKDGITQHVQFGVVGPYRTMLHVTGSLTRSGIELDGLRKAVKSVQWL